MNFSGVVRLLSCVAVAYFGPNFSGHRPVRAGQPLTQEERVALATTLEQNDVKWKSALRDVEWYLVNKYVETTPRQLTYYECRHVCVTAKSAKVEVYLTADPTVPGPTTFDQARIMAVWACNRDYSFYVHRYTQDPLIPAEKLHLESLDATDFPARDEAFWKEHVNPFLSGARFSAPDMLVKGELSDEVGSYRLLSAEWIGVANKSDCVIEVGAFQHGVEHPYATHRAVTSHVSNWAITESTRVQPTPPITTITRTQYASLKSTVFPTSFEGNTHSARKDAEYSATFSLLLPIKAAESEFRLRHYGLSEPGPRWGTWLWSGALYTLFGGIIALWVIQRTRKGLQSSQ
jgi:hypothetical protein